MLICVSLTLSIAADCLRRTEWLGDERMSLSLMRQLCLLTEQQGKLPQCVGSPPARDPLCRLAHASCPVGRGEFIRAFKIISYQSYLFESCFTATKIWILVN